MVFAVRAWLLLEEIRVSPFMIFAVFDVLLKYRGLHVVVNICIGLNCSFFTLGPKLYLQFFNMYPKLAPWCTIM